MAAHLPDRPNYHAVRVTLGILVKKGFVRHRKEGPRYVYSPVIPLERAKRSAISHVLSTFFRGSPSAAIVTLLDVSRGALTERDLADIGRLIENAKSRGGQR